jgi:hypothetical protein
MINAHGFVDPEGVGERGGGGGDGVWGRAHRGRHKAELGGVWALSLSPDLQQITFTH